MKLYRYRKIENALTEIEKGTFYFASKDELNDPIEGYVSLYFQGDKPAWEGLFKNYIYSLFVCIQHYLLSSQTLYDQKNSIENIFKNFQSHAVLVDIHFFDDVPMGKLLRTCLKFF